MDLYNAIPMVEQFRRKHFDLIDQHQMIKNVQTFATKRQFFHGTHDLTWTDKEHTMVLEVPDTALVFTFHEGEERKLSLNFGMSRVHPDDKYNRKKGREESVRQIEEVDFEMSEFTFSETIFRLFLTGTYKNQIVRLTLDLKPGRNFAWFTFGQILP